MSETSTRRCYDECGATGCSYPTNCAAVPVIYRDLDAVTLSQARAAALAQGRREGLEWQPISEAPYGQEVRIQAGEMTFLAMLVKDGSMLEDETPCDQWQATREGEHPPCWSDGACWASNADDCASLQPTGWVSALATTPTETQKPETGKSAGLDRP